MVVIDWTDIYPPLLMHIFRYVADYRSIVACTLTCKKWSKAAVDDYLWYMVYKDEGFNIRPSLLSWSPQLKETKDVRSIILPELFGNTVGWRKEFAIQAQRRKQESDALRNRWNRAAVPYESYHYYHTPLPPPVPPPALPPIPPPVPPPLPPPPQQRSVVQSFKNWLKK
eukprot:TRINITY_DN6706_c0_g1_i1.p1 TRINITY_DN6706_c0_g1~~TRINITY_DN6706_c0_g1_i1.p1  ORF type:complete len:169 (-),score=37.61 TRINITY_DN6706_c0_g1_i1:123-629(-)